MKKRIILLNYTGVHNHIGCQAVSSVIKEQASKRNWEIILVCNVAEPVPESLPESDLVIVNGEGSLHHSRYPDLIKIASKRRSVLINTSYFDNWYPLKDLKSFKIISCRESLSQQELEKVGIENVRIVPDFSYSFNYPPLVLPPMSDVEIKERRQVLLIDSMVTGQSKVGYTLTGGMETFLQLAKTFGRVCTGRFHGISLAAAYEMPFSAYPSNTNKSKGVMTDIGIPELFFKTREEALLNIPKEFSTDQLRRIRNYFAEAKVKTEALFDDIDKII